MQHRSSHIRVAVIGAWVLAILLVIYAVFFAQERPDVICVVGGIASAAITVFVLGHRAMTMVLCVSFYVSVAWMATVHVPPAVAATAAVLAVPLVSILLRERMVAAVWRTSDRSTHETA